MEKEFLIEKDLHFRNNLHKITIFRELEGGILNEKLAAERSEVPTKAGIGIWQEIAKSVGLLNG